MKTSVALCTYNGEQFLKEQIDSILNQTIKVDEIVVCDDGSTDKTIAILKKYESENPGIFKIHQNEKNLRSVKNFEKAISLCKNEIIFLSDQDDIWVKNKVEIILKNFKENPNISVIATNGFGIDEEGNLLDIISVWDIPALIKKRDYIFDYFNTLTFVGNFATGATMAFRSEIRKKIIPFPILEGYHHDEWIAKKTAMDDELLFLEEKLIYYREHSSQQVGGIFFKNTDAKRESLIDFFSLEKKEMTFINYKRLIKKLALAYQRNIELTKNAEQKKFFQQQTELSEKKYHLIRKQAREKFPIQYFFMNMFDKITGKRKIN